MDGPNVPDDHSHKPDELSVSIKDSISNCEFGNNVVKVYYPSSELFKTVEDSEPAASQVQDLPEPEDSDDEED